MAKKIIVAGGGHGVISLPLPIYLFFCRNTGALTARFA